MQRDLARYHRQMLLAGFGEGAQRRLLDSTVLLLGCGALGCVVAECLARAGVGHLVIVDRDIVELTNLQRQLLFDERDASEGLPKAEAARRRIRSINSEVRVTAIVDDLDHGNIERLAESADLFVDGLDNLETRYLANDLAVKTGRPYVYGAAVGANGMAFAVLPHGSGDSPWETHPAGNLATPCFRCVFPEAPPPGTGATCDTVGVLNAVTTLIGSYEVAEALKILAGRHERVCRSLLAVDLWDNDFQLLDTSSAYDHADCPCCRHRRFDYLEGRAGSRTAVLCGRDAVQLRLRQDGARVDLASVAIRLREHGTIRVSEHLLRACIADSGRDYEITLFPDGRAIVKGTDQPEVARSLYARYVGS